MKAGYAMFDIILLRHGESLGNANRQIQGHFDTPLSEVGAKQAYVLADYWHGRQLSFDRVISSPLIRAKTTAEIIANNLGLMVEENILWMERGFGSWEGQSFEELQKQALLTQIFHPYIRPGESGESLMDTYQRAVKAVQELLNQVEGHYLVVSHGAFLNMVIYHILGIDPQKFSIGPRFIIKNAAYTHVVYDPASGLWRVLGYNLQAPGQP